jgi:hypothetical protein
MNIIDAPILRKTKTAFSTPVLPINIINSETNINQNLWAIIDTGADECSFPAETAELLGHNLKAGEQKIISTGNGSTCAYLHTVTIQVFDPRILHHSARYVHPIFTLENVLINFIETLKVGLLGVTNFLENFRLIIDYPKGTFSLLIP